MTLSAQTPLPPDEPGSPSAVATARAEGLDTSVLTQWQLIRLRFRRHKVALFSLYLLFALYLLALFAGFFAPYSQNWRNVDYTNCHPLIPRFSFTEGFHLLGVERHRDPVTLRAAYVVDRDDAVPLGFFVPGEPYQLLWLVETRIRFFGVDEQAWREQTGAPADAEPPPFFLLGSDRFGHDIFSRIVHGSRISLSIGLVSIVITFLIGVTLGGISGYVGGLTDNIIQRGIEIIASFPQLPLWLAFGALMPRHWTALQGYFAITVLLSLLGWTGLARVVRGKILSLREEDYAVAARLIGASHTRIIFRHLLPGFSSHIIVSLTLSVPGMILGETALSFLGLGLRPPIVSWGVMLQDCMNMEVVANYPWLLMPVVFIIITVLAFNFLGDGLRDAADPYSGR
ncbi:MAG: ABC transporter permease [Puniceicoccaceae bacterium]|nr:MAG: ABC transporter permease [Puniceicoccaceae bacterium]